MASLVFKLLVSSSRPWVLGSAAVDGGVFVVHRYPIIGGDRRCIYSAWEPLAGHSTMTTFGDRHGHYGKVTTRRLPPALESLPGWPKPGWELRAAAVQRYYAMLAARAKQIVQLAYPETRSSDVVWDDGEAQMYHGDAATNRRLCVSETKRVTLPTR